MVYRKTYYYSKSRQH